MIYRPRGGIFIKRLIPIIILSILLCSSCGSAKSSSELLALVITEVSACPETHFTYYSDAKPGSPHEMSDKTMSDLFGTEDINTLCEDYAVMIGATHTPWEIHVLRARALSGVQELLDSLYTRKDLLARRANTDFSQDEGQRLSAVKVFSHGRYVFLLATDNNTEIESAIKKAV